MTLFLAQRYLNDTGTEHGAFEFRLMNAGTEPLALAKLCYSSMTRIRDDVAVTGAKFQRKFANHVELTPNAKEIGAGEVLTFRIDGLTHPPKNRSQGVLASWIEDAKGNATSAAIGDLEAPAGTQLSPLKDWPEGKVTSQLGLLPWPNSVEVDSFGEAAVAYPADSKDAALFASVAKLHRRLFPSAKAPVSAMPIAGVSVTVKQGDVPAQGYKLTFTADEITLEYSDDQGRIYGVIAIAQILHHAYADDRFARPTSGTVEDAPRFEWRGAHLDVARNFRGADKVLRFVDILAWHRFSHLHWHLTDDEGWRLPSRKFQGLAEHAAKRGRGNALAPQYADGPNGQQGDYSFDEVAEVVERAAEFGITVMPEIDIPGHVTALLSAIPGLKDADETPDSYRSIQGYPNNALNPALSRTYEVLEQILDEICEMFPSPIIHVGGDEVDKKTWSQSPAAQELAKREGLSGTMELQAYFMRKIHEMLKARGRQLGGWDECGEGGGVDRDGSLLFAWQKVETTAALMKEGYDVVATPGQAYYLDMVQADGWNEPGAAWAGVCTPAFCYDFEPSRGLPEGPGKLVGVQAGIWTETIVGDRHFNHMVFPRLSAIAEAGWTQPDNKDRDRFFALSHGMPQL